jgi:hypothetical protein
VADSLLNEYGEVRQTELVADITNMKLEIGANEKQYQAEIEQVEKEKAAFEQAEEEKLSSSALPDEDTTTEVADLTEHAEEWAEVEDEMA